MLGLTAAWLVRLRARLLLPVDAPGQKEAAAEADQLSSSLPSNPAVLHGSGHSLEPGPGGTAPPAL